MHDVPDLPDAAVSEVPEAAVSYVKPSMFVLKKPKEPGALSLTAVMGLALADDGGLTHAVVQAILDTITSMW